MISWSSGPLLGNAEAGFASALVGLRSSVVAGGVLCVAGSVVLAAALPTAAELRRPALAHGRTAG